MTDVLVFSRTTGYRHESIPAGIAALRELGRARGFGVTSTEDPDAFTAEGLSRYDAVVFLNTSGDVLAGNTSGDVLAGGHRGALEAYVRGGGGFVGVHCAAATEPGWPFYADLVGARFAGHPDVQPAAIRVDDRAHPATGHLAPLWHRTDEWYDFDRVPSPRVRVLLSLDESSYVGGTMGAGHPIAWCHSLLGGRAFYTAVGHTVSSYAEPAVRAHLLGAVSWAAAGNTTAARSRRRPSPAPPPTARR